MRLLFLSLCLALPVLPASAEDIDPATLDAVTALAARGYADPDGAVIRNVHKSLAKNGKGYCGEITVEAGDGETFTVFHAILEGGTGPSVLRLSDYPADAASPNTVMVERLMRNFGCTE
jgi:hypothetical protein